MLSEGKMKPGNFYWIKVYNRWVVGMYVLEPNYFLLPGNSSYQNILGKNIGIEVKNNNKKFNPSPCFKWYTYSNKFQFWDEPGDFKNHISKCRECYKYLIFQESKR